MSDDLSVRLDLSSQFGEWNGADIFFCQNEKCMKSFAAGELKGVNICKSCGSHLVLSWSLGEKNLLPPDTMLLKKEYSNKSGMVMLVTVVIAGSEITSIHRPQMCLVGQGYRIVAQETLEIPIKGRESLSVKVLKLLFQQPSQDRSVKELSSIYTYWYTDGERETYNNFIRSFYMLVDRILFGKMSRWAYVSITTSGSDVKGEIVPFIQGLYPVITGVRKN